MAMAASHGLDRRIINPSLGERASRPTGKQADFPVCSRLAGQVWDRPMTEACCRLAFGSTMRTGFHAGMLPVTYAGRLTCKPSYGSEGRRPRWRAGQRSALTPRRSILAAGILKKHEGFGDVLQLPAHPI